MHKRFGLISYGTFIYLVIGSYWVTLSWTVLGINPGQDAVGRLLIIGGLCTLLTAPVIGLIVDRVGYRKTTMIGQGFSFFAGLIPSVIIMLNYKLTALILYIIALMVSISTILCISSYERAIKFTVPHNEIKKLRTVISIFQQIAMMIGTAFSGLLIARYSEHLVFLIISLLSILSVTIFIITTRQAEDSLMSEIEKSTSHILSFKNGVFQILHNKSLLIPSVCIAAVFTTAQVVNVSLPAFIKLELKDGSDLFGLCEALWALGGILSAFLLTMLISNNKLHWMPIASLTCLGIFMVGFSQLSNPSLILISCLTMGALFSICRTLSDVNILSICPHEMIGRVKSNIMAVTSVIGIAIYMIPILVKNILPSTLYVIVGLVTIAISIALFSSYRKLVVQFQC